MDDDMVAQEYFCSWEGVRQGSIYGTALALARKAGRIGVIPYDRRFPVNTFWDIGHRDTTAIWFHQDIGGGRHHFIHAYEAAGQDPAHFMAYLKDRGYMYGRHYLPHDAKNVTLASKSNQQGASVWDQLASLGMRSSDMVQVPRTQDRWAAINATRLRIDTACFDEKECRGGLNALTSYHKDWDDKRKCYANDPVHDWSSNYADAFRQWAQAYEATAGAGIFTFPTRSGMGDGSRGLMPANPVVRTVGHRRAGY
jgi:hypothetical protein